MLIWPNECELRASFEQPVCERPSFAPSLLATRRESARCTPNHASTPRQACPKAFHRECLGERAPPDDDDDDKAWFCPSCAEKLGISVM